MYFCCVGPVCSAGRRSVGVGWDPSYSSTKAGNRPSQQFCSTHAPDIINSHGEVSKIFRGVEEGFKLVSCVYQGMCCD